MATADYSQVVELARELAAQGKSMERHGRDVVSKGSLNVKMAWRSSAQRTAGTHGRHYPNSITYDLYTRGGLIESEIGPEAGRPQGGMGAGFEYGGVHQPPHLDGQRALQAEEPRFLAEAERMLADAWVGW